MLPASQWQISDTCNPDGLASSGSDDYVIDDVFVPAEYTLRPGQRQRLEPLYSWYGLLVCSGVGVPLGVAAGAFDTARELLAASKSKAFGSPASEEHSVRAGLAQAGAMIGSARSYVYETLGDLFSTVQRGDEPSLDQRARWAGCGVHAGTTCRDAVQLLVDIVGSATIQQTALLNRRLRDLNVIADRGLTQKRGVGLGRRPVLRPCATRRHIQAPPLHTPCTVWLAPHTQQSPLRHRSGLRWHGDI
jgi:alkylation response protein AidB-like acyl-CoA dehydrogenase